MTTGERFLEAAAGHVNLAAALLARALTRGNPATFKAGYSRESALLAALHLFVTADRAHVEQILAVLPEVTP